MKWYLGFVIGLLISAPAAAQGPAAGLRQSSWQATGLLKVEAPPVRVDSATKHNFKKGALIGGGIGLFLAALSRSAPVEVKCSSGCQIKNFFFLIGASTLIGGIVGLMATNSPKPATNGGIKQLE